MKKENEAMEKVLDVNPAEETPPADNNLTDNALNDVAGGVVYKPGITPAEIAAQMAYEYRTGKG